MSGTPTPPNVATLVEAFTDCGPVVVSARDLTDPRAFKHRPHPLDDHIDAYVAATDAPEPAYELRDLAWRILVDRHLLPELATPVTLAVGAYNAAYARFVDGLTENESHLGFCEVSVSAEQVAEAFLDAAAGVRISPAPVSRPSLLTHGLASLVGRRVEVVFLAAVDAIVGRCLAYRDDAMLLATNGGETVTAVPVAAIAYVTTWQQTFDEDVATLSD